MKWFEDCKIRLMLFVLAAILVGGRSLKGEFKFGTPTNLGPAVNSKAWEMSPSISADGLSLYFASDRAGGSGSFDLWVAKRATTEDDWNQSENIGPIVNSSAYDNGPSISSDGLALYFSDGEWYGDRLNRPGGLGDGDIWMVTRVTTEDQWKPPVNLGPTINSSAYDGEPDISADGLSLYFASKRSGGSGGVDIWVAKRATKQDNWGVPVNLGSPVNSSFTEWAPSISADGLSLLFMSERSANDYDIWIATRKTTADPFGEPVNLGPPVNSSKIEAGPNISADGLTLFLHGNQPGGIGLVSIWQASVEPIVDLNGDGKVDRLDVGLLLVNWGTDNSRYDIGPTPFGDGIVDSKDLMVLAEYGAVLAGDVNYDGLVDFLDLAELAKNWLRRQP